MPIKWRGTRRRPIPENWHSVGRRSSPYHLAGNRNAPHPVNAIFNYAYAALESEIRIKSISDGYDPTIGIMHEGSDGSSKFIFDFMEPERPKVDRAVLDFVKGHVFAGAAQARRGMVSEATARPDVASDGPTASDQVGHRSSLPSDAVASAARSAATLDRGRRRNAATAAS
jgi:CRISPR/Cas system-associated endonuclease Cas1